MDRRRLNRSTIRHAGLQLAVAALVVGCGGVDLTPPTPLTPPRPGPVITLNATHLSWTRDSVVRYSISNVDGVGLYWGCPLESLQYYRDGWQATSALSGGCLGDYPTFVRVAPGDSIGGSHRLTNDIIPQSGWYRFHFWLYRDSLGTLLWDEVSRVSPPFHVGP
jgi:hypothetical protein